MSRSRPHLYVVCPCFFDVPSFRRVHLEVLEVVETEHLGVRPQFVLVDDTAGQDREVETLLELGDVKVLTPPYNLGHQAAIVYALRNMGGHIEADDFVVTMDSDGQDRPGDLPALIAPLRAHAANLQCVSVARRTSRVESISFKVCYLAFRAVFRVLTGTIVGSGNFAAFRGRFSKETIFHPHFDQSYASSLISLPITVVMVPTPRGQRYEGRSRMSFPRLFAHGIRMLMPFTERIAIRGLLASLLLLAADAVVALTSLALGWSLPFSFSWFEFFLAPFMLAAASFLLFVTSSQTSGRALRGLSGPFDRAHREPSTTPPA